MFSKALFVSVLLAIPSLTDAAAVLSEGLGKRSEGFLKIDFDVLKTSKGTDSLQKRDDVYPLALQNKDVYYITELYFGSDKQKIGVDIDTGSADLWVIDSEAGVEGAYGVFDHTTSSTFKESDNFFAVFYLDQSEASGNYSTDDVSLSPNGPTLKDLTFGDATYVRNLTYGILGLGFRNLEVSDQPYDNFPVALKKQGLIEKTAYSIYLNDHESATGTVIFGGIDNAKYTGELHTFPLEPSDPNEPSFYYYIKAQSQSLSLNGTHIPGPSFILDTGASISTLQSDILAEVAKLVGANNYDDKKYFYYWDSLDDIPDGFTIDFEGLSVPIPKSDLFFYSETSSGETVPALVFAPEMGFNILGDPFLRHVYAVFDLEDKTVQLANVKYTDESNITVIS